MYVRINMTGDDKKDFKSLYNTCKKRIESGYRPLILDVLHKDSGDVMEVEFDHVGKPEIMKEMSAHWAFVNADRMWLDTRHYDQLDTK